MTSKYGIKVIRMGERKRGKIVSDIDIARPMGSRVSVGKTLSEIRKELIAKNFGDVLKLIKSDKIREFIIEVLKGVDEKFFTASASYNGKHHPPENNVKGGLVVHTRKLLRVSKAFFEFCGIEDQLLKDKVFAADILHDVDKCGNPWGERTDPQHGLIAKRRLIKVAAIESNPEREDFVHIDQDLMDIIELVSNHMGIYNKPEPTPALKIGEIVTEKTICDVIVGASDLIASRRWLSFKF